MPRLSALDASNTNPTSWSFCRTPSTNDISRSPHSRVVAASYQSCLFGLRCCHFTAQRTTRRKDNAQDTLNIRRTQARVDRQLQSLFCRFSAGTGAGELRKEFEL